MLLPGFLQTEGTQGWLFASAPCWGAMPADGDGTWVVAEGGSSGVPWLQGRVLPPVLCGGRGCRACGQCPAEEGLAGARLSPVVWPVQGTGLQRHFPSCCVQKASHVARSTAGQRDGCPERGFAFEEALVLLLRRELGLAFSLDASPRSCLVLF